MIRLSDPFAFVQRRPGRTGVIACALAAGLAAGSGARATQAPPAAPARPDSAAASESTAADSAGAAAAIPGATFPERPADGVFHVDEAGVLSDADAREIDRTARDLLGDEHVPLVVVTLRSLADHGAAGVPVDRYATALFDEWELGTPDRNVGILLLVSVRDRQARIQLGPGWGGHYDAAARQVMNALILPEFRDAHYSAGALAGVRGLDAIARGRDIPDPPVPLWRWMLAGTIFLAVSAMVFSLANSGRYGWTFSILTGLALLPVLLLRSSAGRDAARTAPDGLAPFETGGGRP